MNKYSKVLALVVMLVLLFSAWRVYGTVGVTKTIEQEDIFYSFREGQRILNGENPYARVLTGNMRDNDKYATYFPLFYELSYASQALGLDQFATWIVFWRRVFIVFNLGIAALLFYAFWRYELEWLGIFAAAFWLFNRWTLTVMSIVHLDFLAIFFLVASLVAFPKNKWLAFLLYGLSLALKQIGIFILPLYLIWVWLSVDKDRVKEILKASLLIGIIPFIASIPFLIWNAKGFFMSVLFSVTRVGSGRFSVLPLDAVMGWNGAIGRLPMLLLFMAIYWFCFSRYIGRYTGAFLVMSVFIGFNTALFVQYLLWLVPLTLLLLLDPKENYSMNYGGVSNV
jgi:hypothetical protein